MFILFIQRNPNLVITLQTHIISLTDMHLKINVSSLRYDLSMTTEKEKKWFCLNLLLAFLDILYDKMASIYMMVLLVENFAG